jgi:DNA-binding transcriptional LysR family regulator
MDTRFLHSFVAVVEHGSVAEAGRRLNLTSAGVAQRVRALEAELGTTLVRRVGRRVHPTEAGRAVFERAGELLQSVRELKIAIVDTLAGELRLGAVSTAMTGILPAIVSKVTVRHPNFSIYVVPGTSMDLYKRVVEGELDAAILVEPPFRILKSCDWQLMRREPLMLIGSEALDVEDPVRILSTQPFIRYDRNHWGGRLGEEYLRDINIKPQERFELDALEAIAVMVDRGLGVSLVPDWAPPWPEGLKLAKKVISESDYIRHIGLIWARTSSRLRLIEAFLDEAKV